MIGPGVGRVVHVRVSLARTCYPGIIMASGPKVCRVRVIHPSTAGIVGGNDEEGDLRREPVVAPNPDGTVRELDWWHYPGECPDRL
jgi:hypothetical protein